MYDMKMQHARMICGIVAHVKDRGVASAAIRCVAIAAECLEEYEEQAEILRILEKIHKETGWGIDFLQPELKKKWRWTENHTQHALNQGMSGQQSGWSNVTHTQQQQAQLANAATNMMQGTPPMGSGSQFGSFSGQGGQSAATTLPPVQAPQMPSPPGRQIPSGIVNPLMRTADFTLSQHPYQNDYVAPNHPSGQDGGFFTRLMEGGVYQQ